MSKQKINLGDEAAQNTVALTAMMGLAREDLMGAVALMMREVTRPST
jgi:polyhydroxyalkanoate synthase subunit PhaC